MAVRRKSGTSTRKKGASTRRKTDDASRSPTRLRAQESVKPTGTMPEGQARAMVPGPMPVHAEIARRAYEIWCLEDRPPGREQAHWFAAERALIVEMKPGASMLASVAS